MTAARVVTWAAILAIPALLWGFLNGAKNDLLERSGSLVKQIHAIGGDNEKAVQSFFIKYRHPESNPNDQDFLFERLWFVLLDCQPSEITYATEQVLKKGVDGREHNARSVRIDGRKRDGEKTTIVLDWMQYRGSWYLTGYEEDGERGTGIVEIPLPGR